MIPWKQFLELIHHGFKVISAVWETASADHKKFKIGKIRPPYVTIAPLHFSHLH
jgi:hypothetical protein